MFFFLYPEIDINLFEFRDLSILIKGYLFILIFILKILDINFNKLYFEILGPPIFKILL